MGPEMNSSKPILKFKISLKKLHKIQRPIMVYLSILQTVVKIVNTGQTSKFFGETFNSILSRFDFLAHSLKTGKTVLKGIM